MMTMITVYLPPLLGVVGIVIAVSAFVRSRNSAFLVMAAVFCFPIIETIVNRLYVSRFAQTQVGPNEWAAPVIEVDVTDSFVYGLLVVAVVYFARNRTSNKNQRRTRDKLAPA